MTIDMNKRTGALLTALVLFTLWVMKPAEFAYAVGWLSGFVQGFWSAFARNMGMTEQGLAAFIFWAAVLILALRWAVSMFSRLLRRPRKAAVE